MMYNFLLIVSTATGTNFDAPCSLPIPYGAHDMVSKQNKFIQNCQKRGRHTQNVG
jgi:hypothetical protein